MRYFLQLSFKGTGYHGWQEQSNSADTVQEICNTALSKVLNHPVKLHGAGRTDTGVHAEYFIAHFDTTVPTIIEKKTNWLYKFNSVTPFTIAFQDIFKVKEDANARFDATSRTYRYDIYVNKNPFLYNNALFYPHSLDIAKMNKACKTLKEYKEFSSFKKTNSNNKTDTCTIKFANWEMQGDKLSFTITADRFLRNMVRAIVGTMLNVGNGKYTHADFCRIIEGKNRSHAGASVAACGLYLTAIEYPPEIFLP
ncbi:MAG TPA: tRNA pseudouridine(38-40) synthase TruA [Bacteroidia bacterium]|jgi:tRNA pseudouridine38-40 synthase|nr:tRNA pseudouridine(38-40) synthase TruA [Bacteroidia bacterium]